MTTNADFWNNIAEAYAQKPVDNPDAFDRKIAITKERMASDHTVLDIGCGTGSLALRLAPFGGHIHGLDISREMIRIAKGKAAEQKVDNVSFHEGPFDDSFDVFGPESLDGVCAYSILHLLEDRHAAVQRVYRLLRPGGFFISSTVCLGNSWVPYTPILIVMRWLGKAPMVKTISSRTIENDIKEVGFVDVSQPDVGAQSRVAFVVARKP